MEAHPALIAIHYLPPYAPEHNPDEYLIGYLKQQVERHAPAGDSQEL